MAESDPALSRSAAARLAREGKVTVNGRAAGPAGSLRMGDVVEYAVPEPAEAGPQPEAVALSIVHSDPDFVVVDKPAGMVTHPAPGHATGTLVSALLGLGGTWSTAGGAARPGIVHRLDMGTSGLILAARNDSAHRHLAAQLATRTLSRTYLAVAMGEVRDAEGVLEGPIGRDPRDRKRMAVVAGGRAARTRFAREAVRSGYTMVRCDLESGRTHQIRVHLAAFGHPIAGDGVYGGARAGRAATRPMLHAYRLRLRHPRTGEEMTFETEPPSDFTEFWESLR